MAKGRIYPILDAPIPSDMKKMGKGEAANYLRWFLDNRDRRIGILLDYLGGLSAETTSEMESALCRAGEWLCENASLEPLDPTLVEQRRQAVGARLAFTVSSQELSHETVAFCYDMAALLGDLFKALLPDFKYTVRLGDQLNVDYGHVVLEKKNRVDLNPYGLCSVMAYKALDGKLTSRDVVETIRTNIAYSL